MVQNFAKVSKKLFQTFAKSLQYIAAPAHVNAKTICQTVGGAK